MSPFLDRSTRFLHGPVGLAPRIMLALAAGGSAVAPVPAAKPAPVAAPQADEDAMPMAAADDGALQAAGFVRDERGLRFVGEAGD